jgi:hypothetical protein
MPRVSAAAVVRFASLGAGAGEDGLKELRVRVQPRVEITDHGVDVKRHYPLLGPQAGDGAARGISTALRAVSELQQQPAGLSRGAAVSQCCRD